MSRTQTTKAFTLIELLVVIAIIGVLATMVMSSISNARQKAQITRTAAQLKAIERGLFAATLEENRGTYWTSAELGGGINIPLGSLLVIEYPNPGWAIKNYLNQGHVYDGFNTLLYYRGNNITASPCTVNADGMMIRSDSTLSLEKRLALNTLIDGGEESNPNCGKITPITAIPGNHNYLYRLTRNPNIIDF